jgi:hypothetical protein
MRKSKILILLCIVLSVSSKSIGQDQEVKSVSSLFEVFSKMSDNIDKLIDKQEAKMLYRHLDYFRNDMNRYLSVRREITNYLEVRNYSSFDTLRVLEAALNLKIQIVKLGMRLETIETYANETLLDGADDILSDIDNGMQVQRTQYINKLEELAKGNKVDKVQLKKDGTVIFKELQNSITLINKIKAKLKTKFSL